MHKLTPMHKMSMDRRSWDERSEEIFQITPPMLHLGEQASSCQTKSFTRAVTQATPFTVVADCATAARLCLQHTSATSTDTSMMRRIAIEVGFTAHIGDLGFVPP
jgi:hypothetical protein